MNLLKSILHPTDFSERSDPAFRLACSLAQEYDARLIVLHVFERPMAFSGVGMIILPPQVDEDPLRERLRDLQEQYPHLPMDLRLIDGEPAEDIVRVAQEAGCDMIVMATHGRAGVGRLIIGSVAEQVLRKAPCPVLTVRNLPGEVHLAGELMGEAASRAMGATDA